MFYGTDYNFREMAVIWSLVTAIWGVSLLFALKAASIDLAPAEKWTVILFTSLAALVPVIGLFLAPVVAIYLINKMADAQLVMIIGAVVLTRFIAAIVALGVERALVAVGLLRG
jgi:hypothetical protein